MSLTLADWPGVTADRLLWLDGEAAAHALARQVKAEHAEALRAVFDELQRQRDEQAARGEAEPAGAAGYRETKPAGAVGYSEAVHQNDRAALLTDRLLALGWEPAAMVGATRPDGSIRWALVPCRPMAVEAARARLARRGIAADAPLPAPAPAVPAPAVQPITTPPAPIQGSLF